MTPEEETLLQTVKAHLEREYSQREAWRSFNPVPWKPSRTSSGLIKYFTPSYQGEYDQFGTLTPPPTTLS